ncbi:MAG: helicase-related protein, partial [Spirochaetota bacterium]
MNPPSRSADEASSLLPIGPFLPEILRLLGEAGSLVLVAEPGAGKTSLVPLAIVGAAGSVGRVVMIEPRRVAAISAAARLSELAGTALGDLVGYRVRGDSRVGKATRIEVVTGGVFVRMIQSDPSLAGVSTVIFDEFHERSLDADLGLALALESRALRGQESAGRLALLVMSATLDLARLASHLGSPALSVPGRVFPIGTRCAQQPIVNVESFVAAAICEASREQGGDILVFLPGMAEIIRVESMLAGEPPARGLEVLRLHGSLPLEEQRRVIAPRPESGRRIILSTSIAESSLTVPRVRTVIDSGLARSQRFDQRSGLNRLVTERESRDRADQRRGRAGRLGPGSCVRAWMETEVLPERSPPEIARADLSGLVLESLVWGGHRRLDLPWLDPPPEAAWAAALELLRELGAIDAEGEVTVRGRAMTALGTEPRLAALVMEGGERESEIRGALWTACLAAAAVAEGIAGDSNDFAQRLISLARGGRPLPNSSRILEEATRLASRAALAGGMEKPRDRQLVEGLLPTLLAAAWPDRVAKRESFSGSSATFALPAGRHLKAAAPLASASWIVALDADAGEALGKVYSGLALDETQALAALGPLSG